MSNIYVNERIEDDYEHLSPNIFYISENVPTEDTKEEYEQQIGRGCSCDKECNSKSNCSCLSASGAKYKTEILAPDVHSTCIIDEVHPNKPIYECNSNCTCSSVCGNRLVQFGPRKNLKIVDAGGKGFGLTSTTDVKAGSFICEYAGEVISEREAKVLYASNKVTGKMNYIFCINEYYGEKVYKTYINPSVFGNIGRYINHSCQPNCVLYPVRVYSIVPKLCIFAKSDINKFSEITFDYGDKNSVVEEASHSEERVKCLCNAQNCRGYLPYCPKI